jgi:hypothetical protein
MTFHASSLQGNFDPCGTSKYDTAALLSSTPLICGFHASLLQDDLSFQLPAPCHENIIGGVVDELMAGREMASNTQADWTPLQIAQEPHGDSTAPLGGGCQLGMDANRSPTLNGTARRQKGTRRAGFRDGKR